MADPLNHDAWAKASEAAEAAWAKHVPGAHTIDYRITPQYFRLNIPVEALANLTPDAHTRILAMLNAWITEHKPVVVKGSTP